MQDSSDDNTRAPRRLAPAAWLALAFAFLLSALVGAATPTAIGASVLPARATASDIAAPARCSPPVADVPTGRPTIAPLSTISLAEGLGSRPDEPQDECVARAVDPESWEQTVEVVARAARRDRAAVASMWWLAAPPRAPPVPRAQDCSRHPVVAMATVHG